MPFSCRFGLVPTLRPRPLAGPGQPYAATTCCRRCRRAYHVLLPSTPCLYCLGTSSAAALPITGARPGPSATTAATTATTAAIWFFANTAAAVAAYAWHHGPRHVRQVLDEVPVHEDGPGARHRFGVIPFPTTATLCPLVSVVPGHTPGSARGDRPRAAQRSLSLSLSLAVAAASRRRRRRGHHRNWWSRDDGIEKVVGLFLQLPFSLRLGLRRPAACRLLLSLCGLLLVLLVRLPALDLLLRLSLLPPLGPLVPNDLPRRAPLGFALAVPVPGLSGRRLLLSLREAQLRRHRRS
mmetsp:Transcript_85448/g.240454  ORF Transcript_85448/g.240454 Transcript_85448/m.240454 type:complete len:295 (-) Transcript_85448:517-1401(-)